MLGSPGLPPEKGSANIEELKFEVLNADVRKPYTAAAQGGSAQQPQYIGGGHTQTSTFSNVIGFGRPLGGFQLGTVQPSQFSNANHATRTLPTTTVYQPGSTMQQPSHGGSFSSTTFQPSGPV